jgi:hypothetical protein
MLRVWLPSGSIPIGREARVFCVKNRVTCDGAPVWLPSGAHAIKKNAIFQTRICNFWTRFVEAARNTVAYKSIRRDGSYFWPPLKI